MKGVLFTPDNIKATVEKRKTQTRRLDHLKEINQEPKEWYYVGMEYAGNSYCAHFESSKYNTTKFIKPRYQVGEVVYLKEKWRIIGAFADSGNDFGIEYLTDASIHEVKWWRDNGNIMGYPIDEKLRSPLFMPELFARYFIKITDVRAENLGVITEEDAIKEGVSIKAVHTRGNLVISEPSYITSFSILWDSINKDYPYDSSPWVFVYSYELVEKP